MPFKPFSKLDSLNAFTQKLDSVKSSINDIDDASFLNFSITELQNKFEDSARIEPLAVRFDEVRATTKSIKIEATSQNKILARRGVKVEIPGTQMGFSIPFDGDPELWTVRPSSFYPEEVFPDVTTEDSFLRFSIDYPVGEPEDTTSKRYHDFNKYIIESLKFLLGDVERHNQNVPHEIASVLSDKKKNALRSMRLASSLGVELKRREEPPAFIIPLERRKSPIVKASPGAYTPEPAIEESEYQYILGVTRSLSIMVERNPNSFVNLDEESIRDHFLFHLNGHYDGRATGETFNRQGKTDILIRENNRNVFIAECKIWHGAKKFVEAIDQLLSYLTWRDCKCALLVFNRQKDSSNVAQRMHDAMQEHASHRRTVAQSLDGDSRYIFVKESEPGREIVITTQIFDFPTP
jgi:hypothetical protein